MTKYRGRAIAERERRLALTPEVRALRAQNVTWTEIGLQLGINRATAMKWGAGVDCEIYRNGHRINAKGFELLNLKLRRAGLSVDARREYLNGLRAEGMRHAA